nr:hypothetical protein [Xanthomonas vasicola]
MKIVFAPQRQRQRGAPHAVQQQWRRIAARYGTARRLSRTNDVHRGCPVLRPKDGLINATGKRSNRIRRAEGAQIADFLPVSAVCGVLPGLQA